MEPLSNNPTKISILYVEDEREAREVFGSILSRKYPDTQLYMAENGAQGLELFEKHRQNIVITDISMPLMNGIRMSSEIKTLNPETIIVAVTAYSNTSYLLDAIEIGINHYVLKPLDYGKIFSILDKSIAMIQMERQVKLHEQEGQVRALELEAANKELEAFNYTVSHDLRNPITNVLGFSQVLLEKCTGSCDESSRQCVQVIHQEIRRMDVMINSLLEFARLSRQPLKKEFVNLADIATTITMELKMRNPERHCSFNIAEHANAYGDPVLLRIVLENLIGNAWKFSAGRELAAIEFGVAKDDGNQTYFVRDNGVGFDNSQVQKLFGVFQRLHSNDDFEGYGIGLATVQRIIQRHGGSIHAESEKGSGATFYFTLGE